MGTRSIAHSVEHSVEHSIERSIERSTQLCRIAALLALALAGCRRSDAAPQRAASSAAPSAAEPVASSAPSSSAAAAPSAAPEAVVVPPLAAAPAGDPGCLDGMARVGTPPKLSKAAAQPAKPLAAAPAKKKPAKPWGFCIDKWEAHLVRQDGGALTLHPHTARPEKGDALLARSAPGFRPQGYVSRVESEAACKASGKRLCSRYEWQRACRGLSRRTYPYAHHGQRGRCNTGKAHLLARLFGNERRAWTYAAFNDPRLDAEPGFLETGGERERCATPEGVFDLVGNLHEWVAGDVTDELVQALEEEPVERKKQPWKKGNGVFMGGFFSTTDEHGPGCTFTTIAHEPTYHDYSTGFRCCADPTP